MRFAGLIAMLTVVWLAGSLAGCSRTAHQAARVSSLADTLANGVPRALVPKLASWAAVWRQAAPGFAVESLSKERTAPFRLEYLWAGAGPIRDGIRQRALVDVISPDSTWSLDFDMYLDFSRGRGSRIVFEQDVDSAPVLADFKRDSISQLAFCGTGCAYDGAYWADDVRCALTGATKTGEQLEGPLCAFLELYDLRSRQWSRWLGPTVGDSGYARYRAASESALVDRLERAWRGSDSTTTSRIFRGARLVERER